MNLKVVITNVSVDFINNLERLAAAFHQLLSEVFHRSLRRQLYRITIYRGFARESFYHFQIATFISCYVCRARDDNKCESSMKPSRSRMLRVSLGSPPSTR